MRLQNASAKLGYSYPSSSAPRSASLRAITVDDRMVRIVGGEIIRDENDPRLRRSLQQAQQPPPSQQRNAGFGSSQAPPAQPQQQQPQADPLQWLSNTLGIGERFVQVPAVFSLPSVSLPLIYAIIAAVVCVYAGWRGAVAVAVGYFIYAHSLTRQTQQQQQQQQQPQRQRRD